jgi:endo-1,4-beta-xylanase
MSPKPVYDRLMSLVKGEWWSKLKARTDGQGECTLRAFHGTHRITVELPNGRSTTQDIRVQRGQPNRFEIVMG